MKVHLTITVESMKKDWGTCTKVSAGRYLIRLDKDAPLLKKVGTLYHELTHMIAWAIFNDPSIDEKREHAVCAAMDRAGRRAWKKHYFGG